MGKESYDRDAGIFQAIEESELVTPLFKDIYLEAALSLVNEIKEDASLSDDMRLENIDCVTAGLIIALIAQSDMARHLQAIGLLRAYPLSLSNLHVVCNEAKNTKEFVLSLGLKALVTRDIPFDLSLFQSKSLLGFVIDNIITEARMQRYALPLNTHLANGPANPFVNTVFSLFYQDSRLDYRLSREGQYDYRAAQQRHILSRM